ncbi:hypothetical protein KAU09_04830 [Candidatus Parcubacteria bacterium]|nr:hypothetical protein [Candidatus Parcubacteria bacterium]
MNEFLNKLSSYNFFNYLLPGIVFVSIIDNFTRFSFIEEDVFLGVFIYYFIGMLISRFGSLIIEPFLKKISFLKFAEYKDFVSASKVDSKIEIFSEANNMYRTFCSMFILMFILKFFELLSVRFIWLQNHELTMLLFVLVLMFIFSYKKQTQYITKRIKMVLK